MRKKKVLIRRRDGIKQHYYKNRASPVYVFSYEEFGLKDQPKKKLVKGAAWERVPVKDANGKIRIISRRTGSDKIVLSQKPIGPKNKLRRFGDTRKDILKAIEDDYARRRKLKSINVYKVKDRGNLEEELKKQGIEILK